jgi:hypothetical protein
MTLRERDLSWMPEDIGGIGSQVLRVDDPYRVIGEQLADIIGDEQFTELYQTTGRAAVSPSLLALVTIFQFLEDLPDRRHRYRGDAKRHFKHLLKAAACNLKRLTRALAARQRLAPAPIALAGAIA